jgi:hypothetical protein
MDIENLAAENARLKAYLSRKGIKITYNKNGSISRIAKPARPMQRHTAITWARKKNIRSSMSMVRRMTKNRAVTERKFKNAVERAELIKEGRAFLAQNGYKIPAKFFDKIPTYALRDNAFYSTVGQNLHYRDGNEEGESEVDAADIQDALKGGVQRIRKMNATVKSQVATQRKKPTVSLKPPSTTQIIKAVVKPRIPPIV